MKGLRKILLSFGPPFLILMSILGFFQRKGQERLQAVPAFVVGGGLIIASALSRSRRRQMLLFKIRNNDQDEMES